ncbi:N-acetylmuramoyl-L-alanine amidase-like domain-containing protein [Croceivirga thetidis]|uniref:DUF1460 domain-containing protein n=1 Tax=Croceivirga thetidis TaxID=2721623 RepID=A0ABX1GMH2_9FLAO|nr:N-acetylmuramoyl-L-alanine amidase-like domain-containing protein [Croceivirga thetidis]NKI31074.1 DUF1460 domain-containing protein [Croceivirga thetidis]
MFRNLFLLCFFMVWGKLLSQITCTPKDSLLVAAKISELQQLKLDSTENKVVEIGKSFLGTPYVEKTLEIGERESLVVNLRGFDCTTFVENVLAFYLLQNAGNSNFENFVDNLKTIRYRYGALEGYSSRLHYFTDWIRNNSTKGLVKEISSDLGGIELEKPIDFMGTHRELYPFLTDDVNYQNILEVEQELAKERLCIIPQDAIASVENQLNDGDIIALATSIKGLDVTHTGYAIRMPNGRIHLLHASISGEVTITQEPLVDYLKKIKNNIGIIVARPL